MNKELNNYNNNPFKEILPGEKVIAVSFKSSDGKIEFCFPCKNTTPFVKIEEKLYDEYPEYKETDNYFLVNGSKVKRFKTIEENNIKSGNTIYLYNVE